MSFPKIRLTWGNVLGILTTAAGFVVNNSSTIAALSPVGGGKLITAGALVLGATKAIVSYNHDNIPDNKKVDVGPVVLEKTGPLKS